MVHECLGGPGTGGFWKLVSEVRADPVLSLRLRRLVTVRSEFRVGAGKKSATSAAGSAKDGSSDHLARLGFGRVVSCSLLVRRFGFDGPATVVSSTSQAEEAKLKRECAVSSV